MMKHRVGLSLLAGLGVFLVACGSDDSSGSPCGPDQVECESSCIPAPDGSLGWVQAKVFDTYGCASSAACHNGTNPLPAVGFNLSNESESFASLVNVESVQDAPKLRVAPNDVNGSYLINKLTGVGLAPGTQLMPLGAPMPICDAAIDGVRDWINDGANP